LDRSRRRPGLLIAGAAVVTLCAAAPPPAPPLKAIRWLAPGVDAGRTLTAEPTECLTLPADPAAARSVELGRAAFRTPLLLGGQAARAGISCDTCHRDGHGNPDFDFPGVSGAPGTADVPASVFSEHRGEGPLNPKPIPNLSGPRAALKVAQDPASRALETDIDGIVTGEFDGHEPPPAVLKGLADYVRALSPGACPAAATHALTAEMALADGRRAVRAALAALDAGDTAAAAVMVEAARSRLGDVDERYAVAGLAPERALLAGAARDLAAAEADTRTDAAAGRRDLTLWLDRAPSWTPQVLAAAPRSLYAPAVLAAAIKTPP
jgi:hypothetical protein